MKGTARSGITVGEPNPYDRLRLRKLAGQLKEPREPATIRTGTIVSRDADGGLQVSLGYDDELGAATVVAVNALKGLYVGGETVMMIKNGSDWFVIGSFPAAGTRSTWTPVLTASTTNPTTYTSAGRYYLHGNLCTAVGQITFNGVGIGSGTYSISLPFTKASGQRYLGTAMLEDVSAAGAGIYNLVAVNFDASSVVDRFRYVNAAGGLSTTLNWAHNAPVTMASGDFLDFSIQYEVAIT